MKNWYKNCWMWLIAITVILCIILLSILIVHSFTFVQIFMNPTFWSIAGIIVTTVTSIITHRIIIKRDKQTNTISELSKIRQKYPDLHNCEAADCKTEEELEIKRTAYLKSMEFFCVGVKEDVYDLNIVYKMSGHLLTRQYDSYMKDHAETRIKNDWEYKAYFEVMEQLVEIRKGEK